MAVTVGVASERVRAAVNGGLYFDIPCVVATELALVVSCGIILKCLLDRFTIRSPGHSPCPRLCPVVHARNSAICVSGMGRLTLYGTHLHLSTSATGRPLTRATHSSYLTDCGPVQGVMSRPMVLCRDRV